VTGVWWWIFVGGAIGTGIRYWLSYLVFRENEIELFPYHLESEVFPWATLLVNLVGSFLIGLVASAPAQVLGPGAREALMSGVCGGLTTFSTFSEQIVLMLLEGAVIPALLDILLSLSLGVIAVAYGFKVGHWWWPP
jgi:CrcB protein